MRLTTIAAVVLLALGAGVALAACGDDEEATTDVAGDARETTQPRETRPERTTPAEPPAKTIVIRNGEPVEGVQELRFDAGEQIRFRVRSDVADEVHVHGYDLSRDVAAGGSVSFSFPADIEGIFEVELEERGEQIAELRVEP